MKMSIATVSLSGDLAEKLEAIAAAGFKGVEIFENDLLSFDGTPADVRKRVADLGLEIITFQPFRDFEGMPPESRERIFARAERKFDLMAELGCDLRREQSCLLGLLLQLMTQVIGKTVPSSVARFSRDHDATDKGCHALA